MGLIINEKGQYIWIEDNTFDETVTMPEPIPTFEERLEACEAAITEIAEVIAGG